MPTVRTGLILYFDRDDEKNVRAFVTQEELEKARADKPDTRYIGVVLKGHIDLAPGETLEAITFKPKKGRWRGYAKMAR